MRLLEFTKITNILGKEHKIHIKEGKGWASNITTRTLYYKKDDIYTLPEDHLLGLLLHEVAHIHYTTAVTTPTKNKELLHATLNVLEDIAIERIISNDYPNAGEILDSTRTEMLDKLISLLPKMANTSIYEKALYYAVAKFDNRGYEIGREDYEKLGEKISQIMLKYQNKIYTRPKTAGLLPIAKEIVDLIIKEAGEPSDDDKQQLMDTAMHGQESNTDTITDNTKQQIINALKQPGTSWKENTPFHSDITFIDTIADQANSIGKKLRTILKRNNAMEFGGRYRTGKMLTKRLTRTKIAKDRRPFTRRIIKSNQSYAFAIASDVSGSMFQSRRKINPASYALSSLFMVSEALRLAGIPRSIIVFGAQAIVAAPISRKQIPWQQLSNSTLINATHQGGTCINLAINTCVEELQNTRAERKILIILTDGESDLDDMKTAHKKATQAGIECLGITLGNSSTDMDQTFSKTKNTHIHDMNNTINIGQAFIDILKQSITLSQKLS
mgnify:FL=1